MSDIDARIKRLLDKLENPNLTVQEQAQLESKINYLTTLKPQE